MAEKISDTIEFFIKEQIDGNEQPEALLKRNELAARFGCAPSQINYVIRTRFSRDRGYLGGFLSSTVRGETYGAKLEIRVYAPACENGNGLSEIVGDILSGLERADDEKIITSASATSIEFDPNMNAIYRTVQISIEFCVCEED